MLMQDSYKNVQLMGSLKLLIEVSSEMFGTSEESQTKGPSYAFRE